MSDSHAPPDGALQTHAVEFRGRGREYFRIWIVNVALTVITLGLYSPWAKVRTQRYFYGNTFLAGDSFEYHASPWRILLGRSIALVLFAGYTASAVVLPATIGIWILILAAVLPWLANSSIRFNARNSSWRNVRFRFSATYFEAFMAYVIWSATALSLFFLIPYARRVQDYFYVNHHRFGGRAFKTEFGAGRMYAIYVFGFIAIVGMLVIAIGVFFGIVAAKTRLHDYLDRMPMPNIPMDFPVIIIGTMGLASVFVSSFVSAMITNVVIGNTTLEGGHHLSSRQSPIVVGWIVVTNTLLTLATLGLYYPFARIRLARYRMGKYAVIAAGNLDDFTSEVLEQQSAIGQEISGFFDFGFGL